MILVMLLQESKGKKKESKYCIDVMKKHFNEEHAMTKKDEYFENSTKCCVFDNDCW